MTRSSNRVRWRACRCRWWTGIPCVMRNLISLKFAQKTWREIRLFSLFLSRTKNRFTCLTISIIHQRQVRLRFLRQTRNISWQHKNMTKLRRSKDGRFSREMLWWRNERSKRIFSSREMDIASTRAENESVQPEERYRGELGNGSLILDSGKTGETRGEREETKRGRRHWPAYMTAHRKRNLH